MAENHRREYMFIFAWLTGLTILEVLLASMSIGKGLMISGLIFMAIAKAALVGLYYMHLKSETKILRRTVSICLSIPAFYAVILISEATWRELWRALLL